MPIAQSISAGSLVTPIHMASDSSPVLEAEALAQCGCRAALELAWCSNAVSPPMSNTQPASSWQLGTALMLTSGSSPVLRAETLGACVGRTVLETAFFRHSHLLT
jgi:hypothetical protein